MSTLYISKLAAIAEKAAGENEAAFEAASRAMSETLANKGLVHLYGSGHSVLPVQETYPRYGSYVGFNPLTDLALLSLADRVADVYFQRARITVRQRGARDVGISCGIFADIVHEQLCLWRQLQIREPQRRGTSLHVRH